MARFFTSDTHFGDTRLNLFFRDLFFKDSKEADDLIIKNWNETVKPNDVVFHLGDVALTEKGLEKVKLLNGKKILVKGNYDSKSDTAKFDVSDELLLKYFDKVVDNGFIKIDGKKIYLNHFPKKASKDYFNLVGHIHSLWKVQRNMINVSSDCWNFKPISEETIKFILNAINTGKYDGSVFAGELEQNKETK